jgi:uncharacterized protein (DUF362 family)
MRPFQLSPSPFRRSGAPLVRVARGDDAYQSARAALEPFDLGPAAGRKVLLKPNAGRVAHAGSGIVTNPEVLAATADAFIEAGAEVLVGESPIAGVRTAEAFEESGMAAVARRRGIPLVDMDVRPAVRTALPEGVAIRSLALCAELLEVDLVVSLPVMKMHMHTGVTLGLKNMKGCLWRRSKVKLHMLPPVEGRHEKPIDIAIADMTWALRPHLSVIDGTVGMEGLGPSAGTPKSLGCVVAGAEPFAADAVACALMGIDAGSVDHLRIGSGRGYGCIDLEEITVSPANWREYVDSFARPPASVSIDFAGVEVLDRNSCSACQSTLLMFLKRYADSLHDYFEETPVRIAIGKGHAELPEGTLCIGNCTAKHRSQTLFVHGCPPVASEILSKLSGRPCADTRDGHSGE